jgi:hypothetical protein
MFEKNDAQQALLELLGERKIFHSEDDFKHALAILIHKKYHECKIRLERPFRFNEGSRYEVDLIIENKNILTAFYRNKTIYIS